MAIQSQISLRQLLNSLFLLILVFSATQLLADEQDQMLEFRSEAALALGWNSVENQPSSARAVCLEPSSYKAFPSKNSNNNYTGGFKLVHTKTDIQDAFGLDVAASYRGIAYKVSGSVEYAQSKDVSTDSTNLAGYVTVETRTDSLRAANSPSTELAFVSSKELTATQPLAAQLGGIKIAKEYEQMFLTQPKEFFRQCGDGFVMDIYYGGRLNVVATLDTKTEADKKKLEASLKGSGGGAEVSAKSVVSSAKSVAGTTFNASYQAVGSDGTELNITNIDDVISTFKNFSGNATKNDAGVRMRIVSYESLISDSSDYRFGVADSVSNAARLYNELSSVWHNLAQMKDGPLASKLRWDYSVSKQCLADKQDEIFSFTGKLATSIKACSKQIDSSKGNPSMCKSDSLLSGLNMKPATNDCPATTQIVNDQISQYDYRLFYPAVKEANVLPSCKKYASAEVQKVISSQWLKPVIDLQCAGDFSHPVCNNKIRDQLNKSIQVFDSTVPLQPSGSYLDTCDKKPCTLKWISGGKAQMQCSCRRSGEYKNTAWVSLQCPQKTRLSNCRRTLKYGNCK